MQQLHPVIRRVSYFTSVNKFAHSYNLFHCILRGCVKSFNLTDEHIFSYLIEFNCVHMVSFTIIMVSRYFTETQSLTPEQSRKGDRRGWKRDREEQTCSIHHTWQKRTMAGCCIRASWSDGFTWYTVHPESIHSTLLFPHFVMLQPSFQIVFNWYIT